MYIIGEWHAQTLILTKTHRITAIIVTPFVVGDLMVYRGNNLKGCSWFYLIGTMLLINFSGI